MRGRGQNPVYLLNNLVQAVQHFIIPEPDHPEALRLKKTRPFRIRLGIRMLPTVNLNNQTPFQAEKVDNIGADDMLTPELAVRHLPAPEAAPDFTFGLGLFFS